MNWVLLLFLLVALLVFVKATNKGQNLWSYLVIAGSIMLLISFLYVGTLSSINLMTLEGISHFVKIYFAWLGKLIYNLGHITGNAVKLDWSLPQTNGTSLFR